LSVHDGLLDVCKLFGSLAGDECKLCDGCKRPYFLATVFASTSAFNGDLNKWKVTKVSTMDQSKSIRIVANDLT
jgi:hypothetical protein